MPGPGSGTGPTLSCSGRRSSRSLCWDPRAGPPGEGFPLVAELREGGPDSAPVAAVRLLILSAMFEARARVYEDLGTRPSRPAHRPLGLAAVRPD